MDYMHPTMLEALRGHWPLIEPGTPPAEAQRVAADRAYQHHHAACPQCRAAGTSPNTQQRCPEGAQLWAQYNQAGDPPHFTWLRKRPGRKP